MVVTGEPAGYRAYVPELPTIEITGSSREEIDFVDGGNSGCWLRPTGSCSSYFLAVTVTSMCAAPANAVTPTVVRVGRGSGKFLM